MHNEVKNQLRLNLKYLRNLLGFIRAGRTLAQSELADMLGISRRTLINWESGEIPNPTHRRKLLTLIQENLGLHISESVLMESDLSQAIGPLSVFITPLLVQNEQQKSDRLPANMDTVKRRILWDLMLKIDALDDEGIVRVTEIVDSEIKKLHKS